MNTYTKIALATALAASSTFIQAEELFQVVSTRSSANPSAQYQEKGGCLPRAQAQREHTRIQKEKDSAAGAAWIVTIKSCGNIGTQSTEPLFRVLATRSSANPASRYSEGSGCMPKSQALRQKDRTQAEKDTAAGAGWIVSIEQCK